MAARTVVSYDDITLPYDQSDPPSYSSKSNGPPPSKKRKKNKQKGKHWDNPTAKKPANSQRAEFNKYSNGSNASSKQDQWASYQEDGCDIEAEGDEGEYEDDEESQELTHDEIWDDSALVYAWESAMEEYKLYHGGEEEWKMEPVKKSPLWYNVPIDVPAKRVATTSSTPTPAIMVPSIAPSTTKEETEEDSQPLNFDTFVPSHDPSLESVPVPITANYIPDNPADSTMVSQDEAFSRALSAMYWGGYWTAMYHAQRQMQTPQPNAQASVPETLGSSDNINIEEEDDEEEEEDIEVDDGDFIPTQR